MFKPKTKYQKFIEKNLKKRIKSLHKLSVDREKLIEVFGVDFIYNRTVLDVINSMNIDVVLTSNNFVYSIKLQHNANKILLIKLIECIENIFIQTNAVNEENFHEIYERFNNYAKHVLIDRYVKYHNNMISAIFDIAKSIAYTSPSIAYISPINDNDKKILVRIIYCYNPKITDDNLVTFVELLEMVDTNLNKIFSLAILIYNIARINSSNDTKINLFSIIVNSLKNSKLILQVLGESEKNNISFPFWDSNFLSNKTKSYLNIYCKINIVANYINFSNNATLDNLLAFLDDNDMFKIYFYCFLRETKLLEMETLEIDYKILRNKIRESKYYKYYQGIAKMSILLVCCKPENYYVVIEKVYCRSKNDFGEIIDILKKSHKNLILNFLINNSLYVHYDNVLDHAQNLDEALLLIDMIHSKNNNATYIKKDGHILLSKDKKQEMITHANNLFRTLNSHDNYEKTKKNRSNVSVSIDNNNNNNNNNDNICQDNEVISNNIIIRENDSSKNNNISIPCIICFEFERNNLFIPCKHLACCTSCCSKVEKCPICNTSIETYIEAYIC